MNRLITYKHFLLDLIPLIKENMTDLKKQEDTDYNSGKIFAYYEVLSLIQMQAEAFGININELGLNYELLTELSYKKNKIESEKIKETANIQ